MNVQDFDPRRIASLLGNALEVVVLIDAVGTVLAASESSERIFGWNSVEVIGTNIVSYMHVEDVPIAAAALSVALTEPGTHDCLEVRAMRPDGEVVYCEVLPQNRLATDGAIVLTLRDVSARRQTELHRRNTETRFHLIAESAPVAMFHLNVEGRCQFMNRRWVEITGQEPAEAAGFGWMRHLCPSSREQIVGLVNTTEDHGVLNLSVNHRKNGARDIVARWSQLRTDDGTSLGYVGTAEDVTDRNLLASKLEYQATHDSLTGLPNRQFVLDHLEGVMADPVRAAQLAVLFLDLDDFKTINDSLGHEVGDQVLVSAARRIRSSLRPGDVFGRFGGDEFVLVSEGVVSDEQALLLGDRILETLRVPFVIDAERAYHCRASVGAVRYYVGSTPPSLIADADAAMYQAKEFGRSRTEIFHPEIRSKVLAKFTLESDLRDALEEDQFEVYYQPIVSAGSSSIVGAEALVRWHHPVRGLVSPGSFIPLAEKNGLIVAIGSFVLDKACEQMRLIDDLKLSVNLSACQLNDPFLLETVRRALDRSGLPADRLTLEITESILMEDVQGSARILEELKELGVSLAIDDFGTGYSSLYYLSRLHVDHLKVDQSFVARLGLGFGDTQIVKAVIDLSHGLGLQTTAEGVETVAQFDALNGLSCDHAQGYLFARPMPFADLRRVVSDTSAQAEQ